MEKSIIVDTGVMEFRLTHNGELLRFNPKDQNLYARFLEAVDKIKAVEQQQKSKMAIVAKKKPANLGAENLKILRETDLKMKAILNEVFANDNDFDKILCGASLLAIGSNGRRVIQNLMDALAPVLEEGAQACVDDEVAEAKAKRDERKKNEE